MSYKTSFACLKFLLLASFLQFFQLAKAQYNFEELDAFLSGKNNIPDKNVVAMVWKDTLVFKKELGGFNSKTQAPIASASKWLTAAMVMVFVDEGKISLDDKVSKYIPSFAKYGKNYITIRHCLSHMTGVQAEPIKLLKLLERKKFKSLEEEVDEFASKPIQTNPGEEFRYSNIGLNIAGRILEIVSKKKFDQLIQQRLLRPLGMTKTNFSNPEGAVNPSGGAVSTADDYMKFMVMLLNKGVHKGKQILSEESVEALKKIQTNGVKVGYAPKSAEGFSYALGSWVVEDGANGAASTLASPGLFGTWPMIDFCRGYAYIFFVKSFLGEEKADVQLRIKGMIDDAVNADCK